MKKFIIFGVVIALVISFTAPSMIFAEPGDNSTADGLDSSGQYEMDPNDGDYADEPEEAPSGEEMDVYCVDSDVNLTGGTDAYQETGTDVSDELQANGVDEVNAEAAEIMATTATGAENDDNQDAMWKIVDEDPVDTTPDNDVEEVVLAVMTIADGFVALPENNDTDPGNDTTLQKYLDDENVNEIEVELDEDPLVDSNGDYSEFEATATMENPLVPGITDEGKDVLWYILAGSFNVSFSEADLILEDATTMFDYKDDTDGDGDDTDGDGETTGDHYGISSVPYYFYWWGGDYPEFEEMSVNIDACVDIDEDGDIDKEKGDDLDYFNANTNVVQTVVNPDFIPSLPTGPYNSPNIVATDESGEVITAVPDNVDVDYFNAGKMVVTERDGSYDGGSVYEDVYIGAYYPGRYWYYYHYVYTDYVDGHWVNGAPSVTIPAGWYCSGWSSKTWHDEEVTYPDPYDQRFVIESYSEPCGSDSETYTAWGSFEVTKTDSVTQGLVEGAVYKLTYISGQTNPPAVTEYLLNTGADGKAFVDGLPWGTYELTEESAPSGYGIDSTTYTVYIGGTALFPTGGSVNASKDVENCPTGSITVTKTGLEGSDQATFTLAGPISAPGSWPSITIGNECDGWDDLPYGTYTVTESYPGGNTYAYTSSLGYDMTSDPININGENENPTLGVVNTPDKGEITVCKFDAATEEPLLGSTFQLQYYWCPTNLAAPSYATEVVSGDCGWVNVGDEVTLDETNCHTWYDLLYGEYQIVEVSAPGGYATIDPIAVTVDKENLEKYVEFFDPRIPSRARGSITLNKSGLDATDTAGFTLYDSNGDPVGSEKTVTGNGTVKWTNLPKDTYKIVETTVPAGFNKMDDIAGIVVESGNLDYSFDRTNTKTPPGGGGELEVLGIQELPFTGMHPAIPISGITMILGGIAMFIASLRKKLRRK